MTEEVVWKGAETLRSYLVEIDDLQPFPGNPRRGDVAVVVESLERFGQVRPVLAYGDTIVAGHHVRLAAKELGWSHVAVVPHEFENEEEARRFLLMDNRSHDRGAYELEELAEHLRALDSLAGTGFDDAYLRTLERDLAKWAEQAQSPEMFPPIDPNNLSTDFCCPRCAFSWSGSPRPNG